MLLRVYYIWKLRRRHRFLRGRHPFTTLLRAFLSRSFKNRNCNTSASAYNRGGINAQKIGSAPFKDRCRPVKTDILHENYLQGAIHPIATSRFFAYRAPTLYHNYIHYAIVNLCAFRRNYTQITHNLSSFIPKIKKFYRKIADQTVQINNFFELFLFSPQTSRFLSQKRLFFTLAPLKRNYSTSFFLTLNKSVFKADALNGMIG